MSEVLAIFNAISDFVLAGLMLVLMGALLYLLFLALITMVRNKQPRWDAIAYVLAILFLGLAMWRFFPTIAVRTIRVSLEESRPEILLLQDEIRRWLPRLEVTLPAAAPTISSTPVPDTALVIPLVTPTMTEPAITMTATFPISATLLPATATPYPTYTPWPTPTPVPTATPCLVNVNGHWLVCPPTPMIGGN
ncbi:MAG: hypothetical protein KA314_14020 [Chloroflexi bacterium]|nr:hypothetical protein [Chloroflexota bacterium]MBP8056951.1 hypothetical protein [Chloroflexota bacterium]